MSTPSKEADAKNLKKAVTEHYAAIARGEIKGCCDTSSAPSAELYNIASLFFG